MAVLNHILFAYTSAGDRHRNEACFAFPLHFGLADCYYIYTAAGDHMFCKTSFPS